MQTKNTQQPRTPSEVAANPLQFKLQHSRVEVADMLGVALRTLDRLVADEELTVRRIGRRVLITRDAMSRFTRADHTTGGAR